MNQDLLIRLPDNMTIKLNHILDAFKFVFPRA